MVADIDRGRSFFDLVGCDGIVAQVGRGGASASLIVQVGRKLVIIAQGISRRPRSVDKVCQGHVVAAGGLERVRRVDIGVVTVDPWRIRILNLATVKGVVFGCPDVRAIAHEPIPGKVEQIVVGSDLQRPRIGNELHINIVE